MTPIKNVSLAVFTIKLIEEISNNHSISYETILKMNEIYEIIYEERYGVMRFTIKEDEYVSLKIITDEDNIKVEYQSNAGDKNLLYKTSVEFMSKDTANALRAWNVRLTKNRYA